MDVCTHARAMCTVSCYCDCDITSSYSTVHACACIKHESIIIIMWLAQLASPYSYILKTKDSQIESPQPLFCSHFLWKWVSDTAGCVSVMFDVAFNYSSWRLLCMRAGGHWKPFNCDSKFWVAVKWFPVTSRFHAHTQRQLGFSTALHAKKYKVARIIPLRITTTTMIKKTAMKSHHLIPALNLHYVMFVYHHLQSTTSCYSTTITLCSSKINVLN